MSIIPPIGKFASDIINQKYAHTKPSGNKESWDEIADRVVDSVINEDNGIFLTDLLRKYKEICRRLIKERKFIPGGRYLYAAGRKYHPINNCFLFRAHDSREGWGDLSRRCVNALMSGGGIGVDYSPVREEGAVVGGLGGYCTGPIALMNIQNENGRWIKQGGSRRSAIWAALRWAHRDIFKFITQKNWPDWLAQKKREDFNVPAPMDMTNISVGLDDGFFAAYYNTSDRLHATARDVYWQTVGQMLRTAEPGFSIDCGVNSGETLRNACTELTSRDDNDVCNLGSLVLPRFASLDDFEEAVYAAVLFLVCGSVYSHLPFPEIAPVLEKNRRIGLGLMGFHEWCLRRDRRYGPDLELSRWLAVYAKSTYFAHEVEDVMGVSRSVKTRAVAPNGTIAIAAETTSSIEPIFAVALLRRYLDGQTWKAQYIVESAAKRLIDEGCDPDLIEDAHDLAEDVERRVSFQAWVQEYVDHAISSTINLPAWGSSVNNEDTVRPFGEMLLKYLPRLRGITVYPDGCRGGQPLNRVPYREAVKHLGKTYTMNGEHFTAEVQEYTNEVSCPGGVCGV